MQVKARFMSVWQIQWILAVLLSESVVLSSTDARLWSHCLNSTYYTPPRCIDHPDGYGCDCGPGFHWNTFVCMSNAIDSRFEFSKQTPVRYTLLVGKAFPQLYSFTIAFWIRIPEPDMQGTILSYKHVNTTDLLIMRSGPRLTFGVWGNITKSPFRFEKDTWCHVVWTWASIDGSWQLYVNGESKQSGVLGKNEPVPLGGEFVLGQASRTDFKFDEKKAFVGELTHLNIWSHVLSPVDVQTIWMSCNLYHCGDAVQWTEFRRGTRGAMKMRWPSGVIRGGCFTEEEIGVSCNKYCSDTIGAQCNEQIVENIRWTRTPARNNITILCPRDRLASHVNKNASGVRPCFLRSDENEGEWGLANIDRCISDSLRTLKYKFQTHVLGDYIEVETLLVLGQELLNHTETHTYGNPVDVATVIDLLEMFVSTQSHVIRLEVEQWTDRGQTYATTRERFPTLDETKEFMRITSDVVNNILDEKHQLGWNDTTPPGVEGDSLMKVVEVFSHVLARSLQNHIADGSIDGKIGYEEAHLKSARPKIELSVETQWIERLRAAKFPAPADAAYGIQTKYGTIELPKIDSPAGNESFGSAFIKIASLRFRGMSAMLPNHDTRATGRKAKEDNINTPLIGVFIYSGDTDRSSNLSTHILYTLPYLDTFNISNPECVRLEHGTILGGRITQWRWTREGCELREDRGKEAVCACSVTGIFAVTTDMYNVNWNKGEVRPILMNFASYIGCCASAIMCLATCLLHVYYKTGSSTASLHKNLGVSVILGQLVFMIGIDRYDYEFACQLFAVGLHYFFLANFSWLMNEAFNLYIVITYSSHAHGAHSESGSMVRYYILGWVIPGVLVGAFVGSQGENYYSKDYMCWIAWENLWLFVGPAIGIIAVTMMVLVFTAKEHNENSYTKSEKSNKSITLLMKALWTQIILITVVWSFAFISLKMSDRILKYIFGLFNCLQGSFFLVFYLLLNEEIRSIFKTKKKKKTLTAHGFDDIDERSTDSQASTHVIEKSRLKPGFLRRKFDATSKTLHQERKEALALDPRPRRRREQGLRVKRRSRASCENIADEEDERMGSDCEMITSL